MLSSHICFGPVLYTPLEIRYGLVILLLRLKMTNRYRESSLSATFVDVSRCLSYIQHIIF